LFNNKDLKSFFRIKGTVFLILLNIYTEDNFQREVEMSKKSIFWLYIMMPAAVLQTNSGFCGITDAQVKAASKAWSATIFDWTPLAVGAGLAIAGVMFFANKYTYALGAIGGSAFLYGAKAFVGDGQTCLISTAQTILG
jgi:hypothetical protein